MAPSLHKYSVRILALLLLFATVGCGEEEVFDLRDSLRDGKAALEANNPTLAMRKYDEVLQAAPDLCMARYGGFLASLQMGVHAVHRFNKSLFELTTSEFEEYENLNPDATLASFAPGYIPQAVSGDLIERMLVEGLLEPLLESLKQAGEYAGPISDTNCSFSAEVPLRLILGNDRKFDLHVGSRFGPEELSMIMLVVENVRGLVEILMSAQLEVDPLSLLTTYNRTKGKATMGVMRSLAELPASNPDFLDWHPDPERRALFARAEESFARGLDHGLVLARGAHSNMLELSLEDEDRMLYFFDTDLSETMSPGDVMYIQLGGSYKPGQSLAREFESLDFRVSPLLDPDPLYPDQVTSGPGFILLERLNDFLANTAATFRQKRPVGTRISLAPINDLLAIAEISSLIEDVVQWDPNVFFHGPISNMVESRAYAEGVQEGLKTELIVTGDGYPHPAQPLSLRSYLPLYYRPAHDPDQYYFALEGEKSLFYQPLDGMPIYQEFGDFHHFLFDEIPPNDGILQNMPGGVTGLHILNDCIWPPETDVLGLYTYPYIALRDPTLGGSLFGNIDILSGGDCYDDKDEWVVWHRMEHYSFNKILAHFAERLVRYLVSAGSLLE